LSISLACNDKFYTIQVNIFYVIKNYLKDLGSCIGKNTRNLFSNLTSYVKMFSLNTEKLNNE